MSDLRVGDTSQLRAAAGRAKPGDRILLAPGVHPGGVWLENLHGAPGKPIVLTSADPKRPSVIAGGSECLHLARVSHVTLADLELRGASGNGLNIDDGGDFGKPAHDIVLNRLHVHTIGPDGNRDGVKLSGVDRFTVDRCTLERWGSGGSGIDMVGCHDGSIVRCTFRDGGGEAVQAKGGSARLRIEACRFERFGGRGVNCGGSTGFAFFRPALDRVPPGSRCEARDITIQDCVFSGGGAPVAFVGVDGARFVRNTVWHPGKWALRILQETVDPSFVPSRAGVFADNIVVFRSDSWAEGGVNIGPNTAPQTFRFARNVWFCEDRPERSAPRLPSAEVGGIVGKDPLLRDPAAGDFGLRAGSPAAGRGASGGRTPLPPAR